MCPMQCSTPMTAQTPDTVDDVIAADAEARRRATVHPSSNRHAHDHRSQRKLPPPPPPDLIAPARRHGRLTSEVMAGGSVVEKPDDELVGGVRGLSA